MDQSVQRHADMEEIMGQISLLPALVLSSPNLNGAKSWGQNISMRQAEGGGDGLAVSHYRGPLRVFFSSPCLFTMMHCTACSKGSARPLKADSSLHFHDSCPRRLSHWNNCHPGRFFRMIRRNVFCSNFSVNLTNPNAECLCPSYKMAYFQHLCLQSDLS